MGHALFLFSLAQSYFSIISQSSLSGSHYPSVWNLVTGGRVGRTQTSIVCWWGCGMVQIPLFHQRWSNSGLVSAAEETILSQEKWFQIGPKILVVGPPIIFVICIHFFFFKASQAKEQDVINYSCCACKWVHNDIFIMTYCSSIMTLWKKRVVLEVEPYVSTSPELATG